MSIGRVVLKSISQSKKIANLKSDTARLLYTWLLCHVDVNGCYYADPQVVNAIVFTRLGRSVDEISECLQDMVRVELIEIYEQNGDSFLRIIDFCDKQPNLRINREKPKFPLPSHIQQVKAKTIKLHPQSQEIIEFWNEKAKEKPHTLIACRSISTKLNEVIKTRLSEYGIEETKKAITNYQKLLSHPKSKWHYRWNLYEFMVREKDNIGRFLDWQAVSSNWIEDEQKQITPREIEEEQKRKQEQEKMKKDVFLMIEKIKNMSVEERKEYYETLIDYYQKAIFREAEDILKAKKEYSSKTPERGQKDAM